MGQAVPECARPPCTLQAFRGACARLSRRENPKGILQQSPGLRAASYPGKPRASIPFNLEEVAPASRMSKPLRSDHPTQRCACGVNGTTPLELRRARGYYPG